MSDSADVLEKFYATYNASFAQENKFCCLSPSLSWDNFLDIDREHSYSSSVIKDTKFQHLMPQCLSRCQKEIIHVEDSHFNSSTLSESLSWDYFLDICKHKRSSPYVSSGNFQNSPPKSTCSRGLDSELVDSSREDTSSSESECLSWHSVLVIDSNLGPSTQPKTTCHINHDEMLWDECWAEDTLSEDLISLSCIPFLETDLHQVSSTSFIKNSYELANISQRSSDTVKFEENVRLGLSPLERVRRMVSNFFRRLKRNRV